MKPVTLDDIVIGQYMGDPEKEGDAKFSYQDDTTVPKGSKTPTFACVACHVANERWDGKCLFR